MRNAFGCQQRDRNDVESMWTIEVPYMRERSSNKGHAGEQRYDREHRKKGGDGWPFGARVCTFDRYDCDICGSLPRLPHVSD